jgi:hypothetical protein
MIVFSAWQLFDESIIQVNRQLDVFGGFKTWLLASWRNTPRWGSSKVRHTYSGQNGQKSSFRSMKEEYGKA